MTAMRARPARLIPALCALAAAVVVVGASLWWFLPRAPEPFNMTNVSGQMPGLKLFGARDPAGAAHTAADYRGRVTILYFGYTHCPDLCPTTLAKLARVLDRLGPKAADVAVVFVTVDPKRDTPAVLRRYVQAFDPRIHALRPVGETLDSLANRYAFSVRYGKADADGNYTVGHGSSLYVFDRQGDMRLLGGSTDSVDAITADVRRLL